MGRDLEPGDPARIGPYRLVGVLGSGGMGRVFLGRSAGGRPVAVKVIRADLAADPEFRVRFAREVAAARKVNGLYTALVVDADVDGPVPWLATAYVPGPSLADAVASQGPLPLASLLVLAAGLAEGLDAIHAAGLVHRDLKPSNVLLANDGPRVIDFGISRAVEATALTHTGLVIGSPGFMSPEQADGGEVGPASDMFSLGAVLSFAATGHGPFGTGSTAALIYRIVHGPPRLDDVPDEIRALAERCLAKDPGQRPTAAEILAEFGDTGPTAGWLPEMIVEELHEHTPSATVAPVLPTVTAASVAPSPAVAPAPVVSPVSRPQRGRPLRRRTWLAVALAVAVVVATAVSLTITLLPSNPENGDPALVGVYSASRYGFRGPIGIAVGGGHVWVADYTGNAVTEFNADTGAWIRTMSGGQYGFDKPLAITDDGTHVWVTNSGGNSVTEFNASNGDWVRTLSGGAYGFNTPYQIITDGPRLWVANAFGPSMTELMASDGSLVRTVSGGRYHFNVPVALATDGPHIWVANASTNGTGGSVTELNASNGSLVRVISGSAYGFVGPFSIAVFGTHVWVTNQNGQSVTELNARDGTLVRTISGGRYGFDGPTGIAVDGAHVWVANGAGNSVTELDASTGAWVRTLTSRGYHFNNPDQIILDGTRAWVTNNGEPPGWEGSVTKFTTG